MKARLIIFAVLTVLAFAPNVFGKISVAGRLIQASGKPLAYTEIELVTLDPNEFANEIRITAISGVSGKFAFTDIAPGKYTLSINFNEKPTETSPFSTYFYPDSEIRDTAQIFVIGEHSHFSSINFRLPPKLIQRKITGQVVWADSLPVADALVFANDAEFDEFYATSNTRTDKNGNFSILAFEKRKYVVRALLLKSNEPTMIGILAPLIASGYSEVFTLSGKTEKLKIFLEEDSEIKNLRRRNVGKLIKKP